MTEQLEGRALDEAVASALGWKRYTHKPDGRRCIFWTVGVRVGEFLETRQHSNAPRFGQDPATLPEMLAHLHRDGATQCVILGCYEGHVTACRASVIAPNLHTEGSTPQLAVARLVVAVAKARGGGA